MKELKVAVGVWFLGATSDRFVKEGYREDYTIEDRFKMIGEIEGASGVELHYPSEATDANYKDLKSLAMTSIWKSFSFVPTSGSIRNTNMGSLPIPIPKFGRTPWIWPSAPLTSPSTWKPT